MQVTTSLETRTLFELPKRSLNQFAEFAKVSISFGGEFFGHKSRPVLLRDQVVW